MHKISCDIIQDMIPLCIDDVASDDTKKMVNEHIKDCTICKKEYEMMKTEVILPVNQNENLEEVKSLKSFQKFLKKRKLITMIISITLTFAVLLGTLVTLAVPRKYIPYSDENISISVENEDFYISCNLPYYNGVVVHNPIEVNVDGQTENVVMVYYYYSLWSRYVEPLFGNSKNEQTINSRNFLGAENEITQIYYGEFNKDENFFQDLSKLLEELELIWSK